MTEIANAYVALTAQFPHIKRDIEDALGSVDSSVGGKRAGVGFSAGFAGAVGGAVASVTSKAFDAISNSIGGAISRVDTLNNYPRIMANLGYSATDASDSIELMSDSLVGLPTSLNQMAGVVQQLAPLTGGLAEATDLSLALNNALLAGGKTTDIQANAMEQYTQMLAVGKVDMTAWRSLVGAMPGQVNQLAQSLLGASAGQMDLYNAMQAGDVTFGQFNDAILRLNTEGANGFASFQQQALDSTDGIATGQQNLSTAITRGLATVIAKLQPQINALIGALTSFANAMVPVAVGVIDVALAVGEWAAANNNWLVPLAIIVGTLVAYNKALTLVRAMKVAYAAASYGAAAATYASGIAAKVGAAAYAIQNSSLVQLIVSLRANEALTLRSKIAIVASTVATNAATVAQRALNVAMRANPIGLIVTAIAALVAGLVYFFTQTELGQEIWANVTAAIGAAVTWLYESVIKPVVDAVVVAWNWLGSAIEAVYTGFLKPAFDAIAAVFQWVYDYVIYPIVVAIMLYIGLWAAAITWLWEVAIQPAINWIGQAFEWLHANVIVPVVDAIVAALQWFGEVFSWLYENVIAPVGEFINLAIQAIGIAFQWLQANVIAPVTSFINDALQAVGAAFTWLNDTIIQPALAAAGAAFQWIYDSIIAPVASFISDAINAIGSTVEAVFSGIADFIGNAFQKALEFVRPPLNALIDLINSVIGGLNSISVDIPDWVPVVGGQTFGLDIPTIPKLAEGGIVRGSRTGTLALIGEAGRGRDEAVIPLPPGWQQNGLGGVGTSIEFNVHPAPGMSEEAIGVTAADRLGWMLRGA